MKTVLQVWPKQPPLEYVPPTPLTDAERIARLEWELWGDEPSQRILNWMEDRRGRLIDRPVTKTPLPLCERKR